MNDVTFVVFGATGDLAQKKIFPALQSLFIDKKISEDSQIIAFSRRDWSDEDFRSHIKPFLNPEKDLASFLSKIEYSKGTFDTQDSYIQLKNKIKKDEIIYHLAIQPEFYGDVFKGLASIKKEKDKIIIEKPFGHDLTSAEELQELLDKSFREEQIYRIDHYLGKSGLRNFDHHILKKGEIKEIQVRLLESIDIQGRGEFYETVGALRDVGQNHALAILAHILSPQSRESTLRELGKVEKIERGQYEGYLQEQDVHPNSQTETYFKISFSIHNEKWKDTRFVIEGGKKMKEKKSEIEIVFKDGSSHIQSIDEKGARDAYEVLIEEALQANKTYFVSKDEVEASWRFITPILEEMKKTELKIYK